MAHGTMGMANGHHGATRHSGVVYVYSQSIAKTPMKKMLLAKVALGPDAKFVANELV